MSLAAKLFMLLHVLKTINIGNVCKYYMNIHVIMDLCSDLYS